jgi:molybdopterin-guanine dinucleotide biosynthesis protein A
MADVVGAVLVGGKSRRFGRNKALEEFQGERLIDRQVRMLRTLFPEVLVIANAPEEYLDLGLTVVRDIIPGKGPLGGIYTALVFARSQRVFVTACDMPFVQPIVVEHMVRLAGDHDVVIPEKVVGLEPLHAVYSSRCLPHIKGKLDRGELQVTGFFPAVKVCRLSEEEIGQLDPRGLSFCNINTPDDLTRAKELLEELEGRQVTDGDS